MNKTRFNGLFILLSGAILLTLNHFDLLEKYVVFAMVPLMGAYFLGQYSEKKYGEKEQ